MQNGWAGRLKIRAQRIERLFKSWIRGVPGDAWESIPYVSDSEPVIIGGCGRSGTTLLSAMIDAHPLFFCGPESRLITTPGVHPRRLAAGFDVDESDVRAWIRESGSKMEFVDRFLGGVAAKRGASRWSEKTPGNVRVITRIFEHFPQARFIHVIRDGRDVVCSTRTHPKFRVVDGKEVPTGILRPAGECAERWVEYVEAGREFHGHPRCYELRYEDLVTETRSTLERLLEFLEIPWAEEVLEFHRGRSGVGMNGTERPIHTAALGRWREDLVAEDRETVRRIAGDLLDELGYTERSPW